MPPSVWISVPEVEWVEFFFGHDIFTVSNDVGLSLADRNDGVKFITGGFGSVNVVADLIQETQMNGLAGSSIAGRTGICF